jgi:nucleotide-binding universal stress UspA family protein
MKILLAIDGSEFSEAALRAVIAQTKPKGVEVHVLHVIEPVPLFVAGKYGVAVTDAESLRRTRRGHAERFVLRAVEALRKAGIKAAPVVAEGHAKSKIIDYAAEWNADLIVLGSHGYTAAQRFLLGSVSDAVARHARCSVEIARIPVGQRGRKA